LSSLPILQQSSNVYSHRSRHLTILSSISRTSDGFSWNFSTSKRFLLSIVLFASFGRFHPHSHHLPAITQDGGFGCQSWSFLVGLVSGLFFSWTLSCRCCISDSVDLTGATYGCLTTPCKTSFTAAQPLLQIIVLHTADVCSVTFLLLIKPYISIVKYPFYRRSFCFLSFPPLLPPTRQRQPPRRLSTPTL
jgi:hypothetical protein